MTDARERLERTALLASAAAHDLANAITAVLARCALVRARGVAPAASADLDALEAEAERAALLAQRILRPQVTCAAAVDVDRALGRAAGALALAARGAQVVQELGAPGARVRMDPLDLHRALVNLVANAGAAAGPRGRVWIRSGVEAPQVVVAVEDSGPGLPPGAEERLACPFLSGRAAGTGLGLPSVVAIAEAVGGELRYACRVPHGARFEVRLPMLC